MPSEMMGGNTRPHLNVTSPTPKMLPESSSGKVHQASCILEQSCFLNTASPRKVLLNWGNRWHECHPFRHLTCQRERYACLVVSTSQVRVWAPIVNYLLS